MNNRKRPGPRAVISQYLEVGWDWERDLAMPPELAWRYTCNGHKRPAAYVSGGWSSWEAAAQMAADHLRTDHGVIPVRSLDWRNEGDWVEYQPGSVMHVAAISDTLDGTRTLWASDGLSAVSFDPGADPVVRVFD